MSIVDEIIVSFSVGFAIGFAVGFLIVYLERRMAPCVKHKSGTF